MMAMGSSLLVYLLCLLMAVVPADGEVGPAGEIRLQDVSVQLNNETYDLDIGARLAFAPDGGDLLAEFALDSAGEPLFPARVRLGESGVTAMFDGMSRSARASLGNLEDTPELAPVREFFLSYGDLLRAAAAVDEEAEAAEFEALAALIDRGEPTTTTLEFEDYEAIETQYWTYTITKEDIARLLDALLSGNSELDAALNRYLNATFALSGEAPAEGGVAELFREADVDFTIAVEEYQNEEEAFQLAAMTMQITMEEETVEIPMYVTVDGNTTAVEVYFDVEGTSVVWISVTETAEEGVYSTLDITIADANAQPTAEDAEIAPEEIVAEEASLSEVGGADDPTEVYIGNPADAPLLSAHISVFVGTPDETGASAINAFYDYAFGNSTEVWLTCEGTMMQEDGFLAGEARCSFQLNDANRVLGFEATLIAHGDETLQIAPPAAEPVDVLNGDGAEIAALGAEALGIVEADGAKLLQNETLQRLIGAFTVMQPAAAPTVEEAPDDNGGYDEAVEIRQAQSLEEAEGILGHALPFGEEIAGYAFKDAEVMEDYGYITYENEAGAALSVAVYADYENDVRYRLDESGTLVVDPKNVYHLYGDGEDVYWSAFWDDAELSLEVTFGEGVDLQTASAIVAGMTGAE